jgi:hypothetical protein
MPLILTLALLLFAIPADAATPQTPYGVEKSASAATLKTPDGKPILRYVLGKLPDGERQTSVPCAGYLHPIYTPGGLVLTESGPADHAWLRGLFVAWPQVAGDKPAGFWTCGQKVWKEKGEIVNRQCAAEGRADAGRLSVQNAWTDGQTEIVREHTELAAFAEGGVYVIDLKIALEPTAGEVRLQPWAFAGLTFHGRRGPGESVAVFGPEGEVKLANCAWNNAKTNWPDAPWYAVAMAARGGTACGLAIVNHKDNPKTTWHVTRGIRFLNPNITADKPYTLQEGKPLVLRYRLVAYDGPTPTEVINRLAERFSKRDQSDPAGRQPVIGEPAQRHENVNGQLTSERAGFP